MAEKTNIRLFNYELANSNLRLLARTLILESQFLWRSKCHNGTGFFKTENARFRLLLHS